MGGIDRRIRQGLFIAIFGIASAGSLAVAVAGVSDGNYRPERQHCTGDADDADTPDRVEPGCQALTANLSDGAGHEAGYAGLQQTADGEQPHELVSGGDPSLIDPASGLRLYFGADDNLDNGEHDSSSMIGDGPSDGGAVVFNVDPASLAAWLAAVQAGDTQYLLTHPLPLADAGLGSCADGICISAQTQRRVAYQGGGTGTRSVYDYEGKQWDPETCAGPDDTEADCGPGGIAYWDSLEGQAVVDPGVQIYEDPNPEGSPIGPYPLPAFYVGPCGVVLGGGTLQLPSSPLTNTAGQLVIKTGC